jgi:ABC-type lipoprotein export system ATPase subunit
MAVFKIEDAYFSYDRKVESSVLYVKDLEIPEGKLVFLLGASGSGKSTILEALGLMNNTIANGNVSFVNRKGQSHNLSDLWKDPLAVSRLRKESFSFIFQSTNLMENFSAYENAALPSMIKLGKTKGESVNSASFFMDRVGLGPSVLTEDKYAINLSGGQRQRLSFVRALNTDFDVLLCDEPTGNLDSRNANELLGIVRELVIKTGNSAVVVSHDIDLALHYADLIIGIGKDDLGKGYIDSSLIFDLSKDDKSKVKEKILYLYSVNQPKKVPLGTVKHGIVPKDVQILFNQLFRRNEGKALVGKHWINLFVLSILFFITILAIGFSNGSFKYLSDKMDNPFTQWIIIKIPYDKGTSKVKEISHLIQSKETMQRFQISNVSTFKEDYVKVFTVKGGKLNPKFVLSRTFEQTNGIFDPILKDVLSPANIVRGDGKLFTSHLDLSVIVTEDLVRDVGMEPANASFFPYPTQYSDPLNGILIDTIINVPIRAIVKRIPDKVQIGFTQAFYYFNRGQGNAFNPFEYSSLTYFFEGNSNDAKNVIKELRSVVGGMGDDASVSEAIPYGLSYVPGFKITISLGNGIQKSDYLNLNEKFYNHLKTKKLEVIPILDFDSQLDFKMTFDRGDFYSLNFSNFEEIESFDEWLGSISISEDDPKPLSIDTSRVREKKNFMFLSQVLKILAFLLVVISTLGISIFSSNLLKMHLEKVKMNIGTFLAFGLSSLRLRLIYLQIVASFLLTSALFGFSIAWLVGLGCDKILVSLFVREPDVSFFQLLTPVSLILLSFIFLLSTLSGWFTINKILQKTPGDLIYNR